MKAIRTTIGAAVMVAAMGMTGCSGEPDRATPPDAAESDYRDGEYEATGWYGSLPSHHDVTLTIEADTVTALQITTPAEDATSLGYQQRFAAALPQAVIGRGIDDLEIDRLAGSSGCSEGFMDALAKIKSQAMEGTS
jgi:uncharacterized protein with FMN-binding domain